MTTQRLRGGKPTVKRAAAKKAVSAPIEQVVHQAMTGRPPGSKRHQPEHQRAAAAELIKRIATAPKKTSAKKGTGK